MAVGRHRQKFTTNRLPYVRAYGSQSILLCVCLQHGDKKDKKAKKDEKKVSLLGGESGPTPPERPTPCIFQLTAGASSGYGEGDAIFMLSIQSVSYTHLTLPTKA